MPKVTVVVEKRKKALSRKAAARILLLFINIPWSLLNIQVKDLFLYENLNLFTQLYIKKKVVWSIKYIN